MKVFRPTPGLVFIVFFLAASCAPKPRVVGTTEYWPSSACRDCHYGIFAQYEKSMHSRSFSNPVFQAQYFGELLPRTEAEPGLVEEAESCTACHAPVAYARLKKHVTPEDRLVPPMSEVACDFCHSITGCEGDEPGDGNYKADSVVERKLGPFRTATKWHHMYSEFHTKSEFCGVCHNDSNRHGLRIKSTYTEWKESSFAQEGIQCQDCHMNVQGFLTAGRPVYEDGRAARLGFRLSPYRRRLYTHGFPGAHSRSQVEGAMTVTVEAEQSVASPGDEVAVHVYVDNARSGHKMPTGSADLRLLWLELRAYIGDDGYPVTVSSVSNGPAAYDVTGEEGSDRQFLGEAMPGGNRIYRAVFVDMAGEQTLYSHDASEIIFDNRLNAGEVRKETYRFTIPEDTEYIVWFVATLNYLPYPEPFARALGLPAPEVVEVASEKTAVMLQKD
jgi:hypothetical protein